ncbi:response regulator [Tanticharoenia sakaeratensis]|jgi:two-component system, chemotaxis family, chemotaxis protein CheY|uniref:Chemotaxis protein CheY n=1 Tax=Tanticharoenia sakaeratensis NBRC 103193 TaxID=1231623 RepID=A0A0D6MKK4_9PROT|nr:response regulator [Tanticharoenia sakaeratensis]GAN53783.1 chemotaxis protein CheY [Tanticharoenia sakaeratensis NBRC 103193]GBQ22381.1 chemotaxis protein CheY [Tanticharoenia sakaeratensis NBRC 103193]
MIAASSITVLLVDDQTSIRALLRNNLIQLGFSQIYGARGGAEALAHLEQVPTQLVISDFNMPDMDGLALLRAVRANPRTAKLAFIMLTGQASRELVQQAIADGVNNFIAKPFTSAALKSRIEAVFGAMAAS